MSDVSSAIRASIASVTNDWREAKRKADREGRVRQRDLDRMRRRVRQVTIKDAAYTFMERAYMKASAGGTLPANARQIMYAIRPVVLDETDGKIWEKSSYFTQVLLPDFIKAHPERTAGWDVTFDARGHLVEPHTNHSVDLGTLGVRQYVGNWQDGFKADPDEIEIYKPVPTYGPTNRYKFALFIEKEGFNELLKRARIAERFDIAIMSTKGMSVTASRQLLEHLSETGVTTLVAHDFDKSGFEILNTLQTTTRRYSFNRKVNVVDLGLRLADVGAMGLDSEPVDYDSYADPRRNLIKSGATQEEADFLVREHQFGRRWSGQRVELNAMSSDQFISWLEDKLRAVGVDKVIPDGETLAAAYRRARRMAVIQKAINDALAAENTETDVPVDIEDRVRREIGEDEAWDDVVFRLALEAGS